MDDIKTNVPNKKVIIAIFLVAFLSIVIFVFLVFTLVSGTNFFPSSKKSASLAPLTPAPTQTSLETDYSKINQIIPGETTFAQAQQINGKPESIKRTGVKTYLYYNTPVESKQNVVAVENNIVIYSTENVYGSYRKTVEEYTTELGKPNLQLFDQEDGYPWDIYLTAGTAYKNDGKDVGEILYFTPQTEQSFINGLAKELNLATAPPIEGN